MKLHLKDFLHSHDQEALHQFRVQVKKMRSFLVLLEAGSGNRDLLQHFKPIKSNILFLKQSRNGLTYYP